LAPLARSRARLRSISERESSHAGVSTRNETLVGISSVGSI
jgi:hypothetical protein